jgi:hypothetical protein
MIDLIDERFVSFVCFVFCEILCKKMVSKPNITLRVGEVCQMKLEIIAETSLYSRSSVHSIITGCQ